MSTLRNKRKLAAVNRVNHEGHPYINESRDANMPGVNEVYITPISEAIEMIVTKMCRRSLAGQRLGF